MQESSFYVLVAAGVIIVLLLALLLVVLLGRRSGSDASAYRAEMAQLRGALAQISADVSAVRDNNSNMQTFLANPKQRGAWGEELLENLLGNAFQGQFALQHRFQNGETVDAVLRIRDKLAPIDSKFPMTNYERWVSATTDKDRADAEKLFVRDVRGRITETKKYIRIGENTYPFAFMFLPAESIYYDLVTGRVGADAQTGTLIQQAAVQSVFVVSPATLYVYLQTVMQGLRGLDIEARAAHIVTGIMELRPQLEGFKASYKRMGDAVKGMQNAHDGGGRQLDDLDRTLARLTDTTPTTDASASP